MEKKDGGMAPLAGMLAAQSVNVLHRIRLPRDYTYSSHDAPAHLQHSPMLSLLMPPTMVNILIFATRFKE